MSHLKSPFSWGGGFYAPFYPASFTKLSYLNQVKCLQFLHWYGNCKIFAIRYFIERLLLNLMKIAEDEIILLYFLIRETMRGNATKMIVNLGIFTREGIWKRER